MAPALSKLALRNATLAGATISFLAWLALQARKKQSKRSSDVSCKHSKPRTQDRIIQLIQKKISEKVHYVIGEKSSSKEKAQIDKIFFKRLWTILRILIPGWFTPEAGLLTMVAALLVTRTYCDLWVIGNGTVIESAIIRKDWRSFTRHLFEFMAIAPTLAIVTSLMKYGLSELGLRFRTRLSSHLYKQYMEGYTYYKMSNLDSRIANPDQLLTQDVVRFCSSLTELYSNIMKPLADIIVFLHRLTTSIGFTDYLFFCLVRNPATFFSNPSEFYGPSILISYLILAGYALNIIRKPIVRMTVVEQKLEGEFRYINSRLITNSEEIAFYQGNQREKITLDLAFSKLVNHLRKFIHFKFSMGFLDIIIAKYLGMIVGYFIICQPFFSKKSHLYSSSHITRQQNYYTSGKMLLKLAESIARLVMAGREMSRLAGFTSRVYELINVLQDLQKGSYIRTMVDDNSHKENGIKVDSTLRELPLKPGCGKITHKDNIIRFDKVPLVTPNGDVLVQELNFEVKSGMNVLVCGPNGCGKSSLFRILGELWPLFGGNLTKPLKSKLFYIPQRPYMTLGTLRDQIIYPDTSQNQKKKGISDEELKKYLDLVQLTYLLEREGGLDAVQDWMDVLSGGEKQRIAMARLFYHKPQFAILDECTSAVSVDVEGSMYQYCRQVGITLFTVSHRKSLWQHHEYYLHMDGRGSFDFKKIDSDTAEFGS